MIFYTYIYKDPTRNNEPFYVGKGHDSRMYVHLTDPKNEHLKNRIAEIRSKGFEPVVEKVFEGTEKEAFEVERQLIKTLGRRCFNEGTLVNYTDGGEGNYNPSEAIREKISCSLKDYYKRNGTTSKQEKYYSSLHLKMKNNKLSPNIAGENNPFYNVDTFGSKNQNAKFTYIAISPIGKVYYIAKGCLNLFLREFFNGKCVGAFRESRGNVIAKGLAKGWVSFNLSDRTMDNQHPSSIRLIIEKVQRLEREARTSKWMEVGSILTTELVEG